MPSDSGPAQAAREQQSCSRRTNACRGPMIGTKAFTAANFAPANARSNKFNRWYDAKVGRWISEDPIGFAAGDANVYRYVGNWATIFVDPLGLQGDGGGGSARDRLRARAREVGVEDKVDKVLKAADGVGTGWWLGVRDRFIRNWPLHSFSNGQPLVIMTYMGPGFDKNDQGMSGSCGESAEEIWDAVTDTGLDKSHDVDVTLQTENFGDAVHNFVQITFYDENHHRESYVVDNGFVGGPDHVGDYDDRKDAHDRLRN